MLRHLSRLPASDQESALYLSPHRLILIRSLLRGVLSLPSRHVPPPIQAWFLQRLLLQLYPFTSVDHSVSVPKNSAVRFHPPLRHFTLQHPCLAQLMQPDERKELERIAKTFEGSGGGSNKGGMRGVKAPKGYRIEDDVILVSAAQKRIRKRTQGEVAGRAQQTQRKQLHAKPPQRSKAEVEAELSSFL